MKKTQLKDALRNIWKQKISFLSIIVIAMLGVTMFLGIDYAANALRKNASAYYQETAFRDAEIVSTLMLSKQDIDAIRGAEGVTDVEGVYQTAAKVSTGSVRRNANIISTTERINLPTLKEGRMPENEHECVAESRLAQQMGWKIGDTIEVLSASNGTPRFLKGTQFTVTGLAVHPEHACSSIPETLYILVTKDAFDTSMLDGCYMRAEIAADRPADMNRYESEYRATMDSMRTRFEQMGVERAPAREAEAKETAERLLEENRAKLREAEQKLADGRKELDDGAKKLADGEQEYLNGLKELEEGRAKLDASKAELSDGERQLKEGREKLDAAKAELEAGAEQLEAGGQKIASGRRQLASGWNRIESAKTEIRSKLKTALDDLIGEDSAQWLDWAEPIKANPDRSSHVAGDFYITKDFKVGLGASLSDKISTLLATVQVPDRVLRAAFEKLGGEGEYDPDTALELLSGKLASLAGEHQNDYDKLAGGCTKWDRAHRTYLRGLQEYRAAQKKYEEGLRQYEDGEAQYAEKLAMYEDGLRQYEEGEAQYAEAVKKAEDGRRELDEGRAKLQDGEAEYAEALSKYLDGKTRLEEAEKEAESLGVCKWIVIDSFGNAGFVQLLTAANNLKSMEMTFALLFILVGALVIYATVSKMVDEQRRLVGTTKALGFFNREIFAKYLSFGISATLLGCVLGLLLARFWVEGFITRGYNLYFEPNLTKPIIVLLPTLIVFAAGTLLAFFSIWFACMKLLKAPAVQLMQQSVPKGAKKSAASKKAGGSLYSRLILLNIRSDLRRVIVTVISVAGCCALVVIGFTIRNSVSSSLNLQLNEVIHYDGTVSIDPGTNERAAESVKEILDDAHADSCPVSRRNVTVRIKDLDALELYCGDLAAINDMMRISDIHTGKPLLPEEDGVLVSKRFSEIYNVGTGDVIEISLGGTETVKTKIVGVFNIYISRTLFMSSDSFRHLFGRDPGTNAFLVRLNGAEIEPLKERFSAIEGYENYERSDAFKKLFDTATNVMNMVVLLFIFMAAVMAGVVLMNLTNIYIMQKMPELTIMRINGFTVREVIGYVLRETIVTTTAGIVLGVAIGAGIGYKIVRSLEQSFVQFDRHVSIVAWLFGILLTIVFTVVVNVIALKKVKRLKLTDMA